MRQKGFTLIELLVALAVGSLVVVGAVGAIYQVVWGTSRTNSQVVALTDVHQAALRLKKDLVMTQESDDLPVVETYGSTVTLSPGGDTVTLGWTDYTSFGDLEPEERIHASSYELFGNGELQRTYDYEKPSETMSIVGRNITAVDITRLPPPNERVINVVITATEGDMTPRSETLEFSVYLRGEGLQ